MRLVLCAVALALMFASSGGVAQSYPSRPVRIVTAPIGAGNDFMARLIAQGLTAPLGQQLVVDNRPAGILGELVAKSPPDGYTLLAVGSVLWLTPLLQDNVGYDPVKDFAPIAVTSRSVNLLVVHPSLPAGSVKALIALAKARPGQLNYATGGTGSSNHLAGELFKSMAGVNLVRIPYKGAGPAVNDLLSGQVQIMFPTTASSLQHVKSGRLKALGVTSLKPTVLAPGLPALAESGLPGYESVVIYGLFAPAKTPPAIVERLNAELVPFLRSEATTERLLNSGVEPVGSSPRELATVMESEMTRMGKLIKDARIRAN
ncbi:MAG TPA: tripartite tricarboxylate transporter substrate binding protein [Burkholderiales bacterium]|nr:tripartite tricarboxylate transporter substrate binding protein [Burkholderiales bacterium]